MRKTTKLWLIIAASLVLIGCILFAGVMSMLKWDFTKLSTVKYETNTYEISEAFDGISMNTDTADIVFIRSDEGICKVVCYEPENSKHSAIVQDGTLRIDGVHEREWYESIGITLETPKITVYLPQTKYTSLLIKESTGEIEIPKDFKFESIDISTDTGDVKTNASALEVIKIKTSTGDIRVKNISANTLDFSVSTGQVVAKSITCEGDVKINVSTGDTHLTDVACKAIISNGSTGDIFLKNVIATEKLSVERSTGDVKFEKCDAAELFVKTDTGEVAGSFLTDKIFITETSTGNISVPKSTTGGQCRISTDTGDIKIVVKQEY